MFRTQAVAKTGDKRESALFRDPWVVNRTAKQWAWGTTGQKRKTARALRSPIAVVILTVCLGEGCALFPEISGEPG